MIEHLGKFAERELYAKRLTVAGLIAVESAYPSDEAETMTTADRLRRHVVTCQHVLCDSEGRLLFDKDGAWLLALDPEVFHEIIDAVGVSGVLALSQKKT